MLRKSSQSISRRLIVSLSIAICILLFLCFIFISQRNKSLIESELKQSISESIRQAQASLSSALWQFSYEYIDDIVESMFLNEDVVFIKVRDKKDTIITKNRALVPSDHDENVFRTSSDFIYRAVPIFFNQTNVGEFQIAVSRKRIANNVKKNSVELLFIFAIIICILSIIVFMIIRRTVVMPVNDLKKSAKLIMEGDLDTSITINSKDELGHLAQSLELMRGAIKDSFEKIKRTDEIAEINHKLGLEISERKRIEADLVRERDFSLSLLNTAQTIILVMNPDGTIEYINEYMEELSGYTLDEVKGKDWFKTFLYNKDWQRIRKVFMRAIGSIETKGNVNPVVMKDGRELSIEWYDKTLKNTKGEVVGLLAVGQDITKRIEEQEEKKKMEAKLQQSYKMEAIGTLAGGIAHDFNNLLGAILGYTDMAKDDVRSDTHITRYLEKALLAGYKAKDLVKQILAFSRQADVERIVMQPAPIIKEAIKLLTATIPTTIEIQQNIDPKCGVILADPTNLHQILMNLSTNAFHSMEETGGRLEIILKNVDLTKDDIPLGSKCKAGHYVQLTIKDTGPGINPEIKDKIFDPYFTTKGIGKGTGMGLAIIHGIVTSYGGMIKVESELGKGTAFHVYLPVVEKEVSPVEESVEEIAEGKERILLIDDDKLLAEMGHDMLEMLGYKVTVRSNSLEALEVFQNQPDTFDLILTDQTMPGMTGADLAKRMLQIRPDIPIILCTGYSSIISEERTKAIGIKEFALKPLVKKDIAKLVRKVLDGVAQVT